MADNGSDTGPRLKRRGFPPYGVGLVLTLLGGAFLRFWDLGGKSLWRDEFETLAYSMEPLSEIIRRSLEIPFIPIPPLYFIVTHFFLKAGIGPFILRLPAALCSMISVILLYYLVRRWSDQRTAVISAYLLALSPFQIYYAQEARSYAFLLMLCLVSIFFLEKGVEEHFLWLVPWSAVALAILYTHHFGILILGCEILAGPFLFIAGGGLRRRDRYRFMALFAMSVSFILILWKPMIAHLVTGITGNRGIRGISLEPSFTFTELKTMAGLVGLGNGFGAIAVPLLAIAGLLPSGGRDKRRLAVVLIWLLPGIWITLFGKFGHVFRVRYLIFLIPFYFFMVARGAGNLDALVSGHGQIPAGKKSAAASFPVFTSILLIAALVWSLPYYRGYYREEKQNWKAAVAFINAAAAENDVVIVSGRGDEETNLRRFIIDYYGHPGSRTIILHTTGDYRLELKKLLAEGLPIWYVSTEPGNPAAMEKKQLFDRNLEMLSKSGHTTLAPIYLGTNTALSPLEAKFLAQARFKPVKVTPVVPYRLSDEEKRRESYRLLELARSIPDGHVEPHLTRQFIESVDSR